MLNLSKTNGRVDLKEQILEANETWQLTWIDDDDDCEMARQAWMDFMDKKARLSGGKYESMITGFAQEMLHEFDEFCNRMAKEKGINPWTNEPLGSRETEHDSDTKLESDYESFAHGNQYLDRAPDVSFGSGW